MSGGGILGVIFMGDTIRSYISLSDKSDTLVLFVSL